MPISDGPVRSRVTTMKAREGAFSVDVVVPCYNEDAILHSSVRQILDYMRRCRDAGELQVAAFRLILVDDGSKDQTWTIVTELAAANAEVVGVKLSRNFGHQSALLAGLSHVTADVSISLDADLQDDINVIADMLSAYRAGHDLALGVRVDRRSDTSFKRLTAGAYYTLLERLGLTIVRDHADFRLMSRKALAALMRYDEVNLFLRGLVPLLGFSVALIPYKRQSRSAGESKYPLGKMIALAIDGVTSFSSVPLRIVALTGFALFGLSVLLALYVLAIRIIAPTETMPGWASTLLPLIALGGVQILAIGVLGEYVGRIYTEVKRRPRFIVEETHAPTRDNADDA